MIYHKFLKNHSILIKKCNQIINEIEIFFNYNKNVGTVTLCNCNVEISILIHVCIWGQNGQWKIFVLWLDSMDPFWYCHQTSRLVIEYTQKRCMWNETSNFNPCFANRDFVIIWFPCLHMKNKQHTIYYTNYIWWLGR